MFVTNESTRLNTRVSDDLYAKQSPSLPTSLAGKALGVRSDDNATIIIGSIVNAEPWVRQDRRRNDR